MISGTLAIGASIGGVTLQKTVTKTGDHANVYGNANDAISLPAAVALLTYTNDSDGTGTATLSPGHGLSTRTHRPPRRNTRTHQLLRTVRVTQRVRWLTGNCWGVD